MRSRVRRPAALLVLTLLFAVPPGAAEVRFTVPPGDSPCIGPSHAPVTVVEFLDYQ